MNLAKQLGKMKQIFLDTAPVIYFVEKNPDFAFKAQEIFDRLDDGSGFANYACRMPCFAL
jgi:hypothetical protein